MRRSPTRSASRRRNPSYNEEHLARVLRGDEDLEGLNLAGADLSGADLREFYMDKGNFEGANLEGANLEDTGFKGANMRSAKIAGANVNKANFRADLTDADLSNVRGEQTDFQKAKLTGANFRNADLKKAIFTGADLRGANFSGANLSNANLLQADVRGVDFSKTRLDRADLRKIVSDDNTRWPSESGVDITTQPFMQKEHLTFSDPTTSKKFKKWFGNSAVKDATGRPAVVYHGTKNGGFTVFDASNGLGIYFTNSIHLANTYAGQSHGHVSDPVASAGRGIYRVYLKLENPFVHDAKGKNFSDLKIKEFPKARYTEEVALAAEKAGFDGIIFKNLRDSGTFGDYDEPVDVYIVFNPRNIKSATANVGTYDPNDPDIRRNPRLRSTRKPKGRR